MNRNGEIAIVEPVATARSSVRANASAIRVYGAKLLKGDGDLIKPGT